MTQQTTTAATVQPLRQPTITVEELFVKPVSIFSMQSKEKETDEMMAKIMYYLDRIPGVTYQTDTYGNLYATKGKIGKGEAYPSFVCHTDTVHKRFNTKMVYKTAKDGNYYAMSNDDGPEQIGIGGDDFCGIICCLNLLQMRKVIKCAFFLDEEVGCKGSGAGDLTFFDDCRYAIQVDRKGNTDIIVNGNGTRLCSKEFEEAMNALGQHYGYKSTEGRRSDVIKLKERGLGISACNLSAGYYKEHTKQEYVNERDLLNVLEFCIAISKDKKVYPHVFERPIPPKSTYNNTNYSPISNGNRAVGYMANQTRIARKCKECSDADLSDNEGTVCYGCMLDMWECYRLQINKTTGNRILVVIPIVPADATDETSPPPITDPNTQDINFGPSEKCSFCMKPMFQDSERTAGYCEECTACKKCQKVLTMRVELLHGYCTMHIGEHAEGANKCTECGVILSNEVEILEQTCRQCKGMLDSYGI